MRLVLDLYRLSNKYNHQNHAVLEYLKTRIHEPNLVPLVDMQSKNRK